MAQKSTGGSTRTEHHGNQVLHVRGDSDSDMEALFNVLRCQPPLDTSKALKYRNLPASFFKQPEQPRSGLCPSSGFGSCRAHGCLLNVTCGGHGRSVSSPAQLAHHSMASPVPTSTNAQHSKQSSMDRSEFGDDFNSAEQWDKRYYLGNNQWSQQQGELQSPGHPPPQLIYTPPQASHHPRLSGDFSQDVNGPLPPGWEETDAFYMNQMDQSQWYEHQRLNMHQQVSSLRQQSVGNSQMQQQQHICNNSMPHHHHHHGGSSCGAAGGRRPSPNEHYLCMELHRLQKQKERLQHEQEAIACKEKLLNQLVQQHHQSASNSSLDGSPSALVNLNLGGLSTPTHQQGGGGVDSFLGSGQATGGMTTHDNHVRQNSTDSGLGGMGTAYSLPRSPEDYFSNVEEMATEESAGGKMQGLCFGDRKSVV